MTVLFHVGYPKTASTWLQENYFPNIKNVHYINNWETKKLFFDSDALLFNPDEVRQYVNRFTDSNHYLFSSELLTTAINYGWYNGCISRVSADKIKMAFPNAKIIIFIRNQQSLFTSGYQQYIKNGGSFSIKKFLYSNYLFSVEHLFFDKLISYYDSLFGEENVNIFFFEEFQCNPEIFMMRFSERFGLSTSDAIINFNVVNRGLRVHFISLLRILNCFHAKPLGKKFYFIQIPGALRFINRCVKPLNRFRIFGRFATCSELLNDKDIYFLKESYRESNNRLANRVDREKLLKFGYYL